VEPDGTIHDVVVSVHHLDMDAADPVIVCIHHHSETSVARNRERLVYTVPEAGRLLGLGRNAAYDAAKRGDIPTLRVGRLLLVPKTPFHRMLGMTDTVTSTPTEMTDAGAKLPMPQRCPRRREKPNRS
jgi:excisionase family DNA binding protein